MTVTATLLTMKPYAPRFQRVRTGFVGVRWFRVNTADEFAAFNAPGIPQYGDAWSVSAPTLICTGLETDYQGGWDDPTRHEDGLTYVRADYETPNFGRIPIGVPYAECIAGSGTVTVRVDVRSMEDPQSNFGAQIDEGVGVPKKVGSCQVSVVSWPAVFDASRLLELHAEQAINSDAVTLPPFVGTNLQWTLQPGQGSFASFAPGAEGGRFKLAILIDVSRDWDALWQSQDSAGKFSGPVHRSQIYRALPFAGLW